MSINSYLDQQDLRSPKFNQWKKLWPIHLLNHIKSDREIENRSAHNKTDVFLDCTLHSTCHLKFHKAKTKSLLYWHMENDYMLREQLTMNNINLINIWHTFWLLTWRPPFLIGLNFLNSFSSREGVTFKGSSFL